MAEEHIQPGGPPPLPPTPRPGGTPREQVSPGLPPRTDQAVTRNAPLSGSASAVTPSPFEQEVLGRSELESFLRWLGGLIIILGAGWALIAFAGYLLMMRYGWSLPVVAVTLYAVSFGLFYTLEQGLWLSRFMGLRLGPHSTALTETLFFWILGPAGLLLRSTAAERPPAPLPSERRTTPATDSAREIVETIVFVVVLVLLLKTFLAEAFVIPTGSMADTLRGYHKTVKCEQCGYKFPVNLSGQVDPDDPPPRPVTAARCPNCEYENRLLRREDEP